MRILLKAIHRFNTNLIKLPMAFFTELEHIMEKSMVTHSSTLAWKIPWMEEPGRLQSMGLRRVGHNWVTSLSLLCIGEGNGNPLQCSCLENPRDGGAWWAAVYGVAWSRTQLKQLSSSSSRTHHFTICMETQKTSNSQSNLEKVEWNWRNQPSWLQTILQSYSHQDSMVLAQRQKYRSMEQNRKPRDKYMHLWTPYIWQRRQKYTRRKYSLFNK